jgi:EAL domain-containing protein (putative c-di-GMP-specific phosphodiesterase class I)
MLRTIRKLFFSEDAPPAGAGDNEKITLKDVLDNNWFELWYQPKIVLRSKQLVGAEALVRARHPTRGVLPPGLFLPGAPEADMLRVTERVILTALRDWEDFAVYGMSMRIAVNTPVSALTKLPIAQMIRTRRPKAENWPGLILEVTEDEIIHDLEIANDVANQLAEIDCRLALDDFGAGYSSLARLKQLPFSELKIDRAYVTDCHKDKVTEGLCTAMIELGQRFGLKTVAEGIESIHECHKLQGLGCDIGQGYLFAKPMSKQQFLGMVYRRMARRPDDIDADGIAVSPAIGGRQAR